MPDLKFATGTWIYGSLGDRFNPSGYQQPLDVFDRVKRISEIPGVEAVEMIYPGDFEAGVDSVAEFLNVAGLDCCIVGVDLAGDRMWKSGTFSSAERTVSKAAVDTARKAMDVAAALGADLVNVWPGQDGHDYPFQVDYSRQWLRFRESLEEVTAHRGDVTVCLEYKHREPRARSLVDTAAKAALMCSEVNAENLGVTLDSGHSLQAGTGIAEDVALLLREGVLAHVHLNDNRGSWDDDMLVGSVHLLEFLEMLYYLRDGGYEGWLSFDVFPYREDPGAVVGESLAFMRGLESLLERLGMRTLGAAIEGDDPVVALSRIREELLP